MLNSLFQNASPTKLIYVSASGAANGDGSAGNPFSTIQAAVNAATPGTAIMVRAGTYNENIKLPNTGGTADKPIWLVSADGPQAAIIHAKSDTLPAIKALGTDNVIIKGFEIQGGQYGIQFNQSGSNFSNLVNNVVIEGNVVHGQVKDGIKVGEGNNIIVANNVIYNTDEEGIDLLSVHNGVVANNTVRDITGGTSGIGVKGGSTDILITGNSISNIIGDGLAIGGWTGEKFFRPGDGFTEASNVVAVNNAISDITKNALSVRGAEDVLVTGNVIKDNPKYMDAIYVSGGNPDIADRAESKNVEITGNIISRTTNVVRVDAGNGVGLNIHDNPLKGELAGAVGASTVDLWTNKVSLAPAVSAMLGLAGGATTVKASALEATVAADVIKIVEPKALSLVGTSAAESLTGGDLNDTLDGALGADTLTGGLGDDIYLVRSSTAKQVEGINGGTDTALVFSTEYTLAKNIENATVKIATSAKIFGNASDNIIIGGTGADLLAGGTGENWLYGEAGNDRLRSDQGGTDHLYGGAGTDTAEIHREAAVVGLSLDMSRDKTLSDGSTFDSIEELVFYSGHGADTLVGGAGDDLFDAGDGSAIDRLEGRGGEDILKGGAGDLLFGGDGNDAIYIDGAAGQIDGGAGTDRIYVEADIAFAKGSVVNVERAFVNAGRTVDFSQLTTGLKIETSGTPGVNVKGTSGSDTIIGGGRDDVIFGGGGKDSLTGGAGHDTFVWSSVSEGSDTVTDFQRGYDQLDLSALKAPGVSISFAHLSSGLGVYVDSGHDHILLATLKGVDGTSLTHGVDYVY